MLTLKLMLNIWRHEEQWGDFDRSGFGREAPSVETPAISYPASPQRKPKNDGTYRMPALKRR